MPIYEYKCQKCERVIEVMQKVSDPAPTKCEACGTQNSFERLVSRSSFQLKGGGWYSDLYSSSKKGSSESSSSTSSATKTDAPAASSTATSSTSSSTTSSTASASSSSSSSGGSSGSST